MTPDQFELPLAQTAGIVGALCGLSNEGSYLSCLTTAYLRLKAFGEIPEINEFGIVVQPVICMTSKRGDYSRSERSSLRKTL
jgi:hypothetical protein